MKKYRSLVLLSLILVCFGLLFNVNCRREDSERKTNKMIPGKKLINAEYVGRESCRECHELQYNLYMGSDHDEAMQPATDEYVLGDFNDASFTHFGITNRFYKRDGKFYMYTEGEGGEMQEFEIKYTFGVRPLQQYLVEFPGGRYQCLPVCWDNRPKEEGGQKWFHVYGEEHIKPDDVLYWTKVNQNWNYMCAECHSTNLRKDYDYKTRTYHTVWNEIDVSCEACHGPGSEHLKWADVVENGGNPEAFPDMGLTVRLKDTDNATWVFMPDSVTAVRSAPRKNDIVVQMCSRCHSRRSVITEDYFHGGSLLSTHWPSLLEEGLYYPDGQILEEVYVYASFLQSKMYQAGVTCKDCHEPHSGKIYVQGNALCYRCHMASEYGSVKHHFHDTEQEGASCYECHMHENTYMQIDPRRDHSIRIPRPDLSDKLGTPNSCNQCHTDQSTAWATQYLKKWYGEDLLNSLHYGEVFFEGRMGHPQVQDQLIKLARNKENAPMIRATAVHLMSGYPDSQTLELLAETVNDSVPLVRYASQNVIQNIRPDNLISLCLPRLKDSIKLVRIMSAYNLAGTPPAQIPETYKQAYLDGIEEYKQSLMINSDHPNTHINFGNIYLRQGDLGKAEASYKEAIDLGPELFAPYINLADLYRRQNRDEEGEKLLKETLKVHPDMAPIHYSLGLLNVREGNHETATEFLKNAALLAPEDPHYSYVYGIALNSQKKPKEAIQFLEKALKQHPFDKEILYILTTLNLEQGNQTKAITYAKKLGKYHPRDNEVRQLLNSLNL